MSKRVAYIRFNAEILKECGGISKDSFVKMLDYLPDDAKIVGMSAECPNAFDKEYRLFVESESFQKNDGDPKSIAAFFKRNPNGSEECTGLDMFHVLTTEARVELFRKQWKASIDSSHSFRTSVINSSEQEIVDLYYKAFPLAKAWRSSGDQIQKLPKDLNPGVRVTKSPMDINDTIQEIANTIHKTPSGQLVGGNLLYIDDYGFPPDYPEQPLGDWAKRVLPQDCKNHDWKEYVGLTEQYRFCTKCDTKEKE